MATNAATQGTVFALRRQIAKIEGRLAERLEERSGEAAAESDIVLRQHGIAVPAGGLLPTGVEDLDRALGGGLPKAALTEIHGTQTRDAGAAAGFALALISMALKQRADRAPLLWIGTAEIFREAALPYAAGLQARFGIAPEDMLLSEAPKLADALWIAEEAARLTTLSAVLLELRGNPQALDLTATRRLHRRAQAGGRPVFLLRQSAHAEPTAAPVRLIVSPAPAGLRQTAGGALARSIGPPGFSVTIGKSRTALPGQFIAEWNFDARSLQQRRPDRPSAENPLAVVSLSQRREGHAAAAGTVVALQPAGDDAAARHQSPREQYATHRRAGRAG
ncbi:ImuA family protein [Mesorhizobium sp. 10J20-29]